MTAAFVLVLTLVAVPAFALPGTDQGSWSWSDLVSGLVDQVVEWVAGADEVEPDGDDEAGPWVDPNGIQAMEPELPTGEAGPWVDPDG